MALYIAILGTKFLEHDQGRLGAIAPTGLNRDIGTSSRRQVTEVCCASAIIKSHRISVASNSSAWTAWASVHSVLCFLSRSSP